MADPSSAYPEPGRSRQNAMGPSRLSAWMNGPAWSRTYMLYSHPPLADATPDRRRPLMAFAPSFLSNTTPGSRRPMARSYHRTYYALPLTNWIRYRPRPALLRAA